MSDSVLLEIRDGVAVVTLNRPQRRNALDLETIGLLADAWDTVDDTPSIRVAVLTGAGEAYCVGGDLKDGWMSRTGSSASIGPERLGRGLLLSSRLRKPLVAAVNGACLGGGMEMLLQTDVRIAAASATFALPEVGVGLIPGAGSTMRLKRQIPFARASELILTGATIEASTAVEIGLVGRVVADADVLTEALAVANRIAANSPVAVQAAKRSIHATGWLPEDDAAPIERAAVREVLASGDAAEGRAAFLEKRTPRFEDR